MSRIHSPRVSSITRSATSALLLVAAACASKISPPVATIATPAAAHVGLAVQLDGSSSVSLRPGQALSYTWSFLALPPRSRSKLNDAHLASPSFIPDTGGTYALRMLVDDGLLAATADVTVVVADDCRPALSGIQQLPERPDVGQTAAISVTAAPACGTDATIVSLQWTIVAAPAGSKAQILLAATATPSFTPDVRGDYDLLVTATDSRGLQSLDTAAAHLRYSTLPCGDNSPVVNSIASAPLSPDVGTQVQLTPTVHDDDKDICVGLSRSYSYAWRLVRLPSGSRAQLNNAAVEKPSFTPDASGTYTVQLVVTDNLGRASAAVTADVVTTVCGAATPTAAAQGPAANVASGTAVQLHTLVHDADNIAYDGLDSAGGPATAPATGCGLALSYTYQWQMISAPAGSAARLNGITLANPSFTADVPGAYTAQVIVLASTGHASAPSLVTVTANPCGSVPLSASIVAPALGITSAAVQLSATVTDNNGACSTPALTTQPFTYAWSLVAAPAGSRATLNSASSATPSFTPDQGGALALGAYLLGLTVTDQLGLKVIALQQTVQVAACNQALPAPTILVNGSATTLAGITGSPTFLGVQGPIADPNAPPATPAAGACAAPVAPFSYAWSIVNQPSGSTAALNNAASATPSFTPDVSGAAAYTVQLVLKDAAGNASAPASVKIDASNCSQALAPPAVATLAAAPFATGVPIALKVTNLATLDANDPAISGSACKAPVAPFSYAWSLVAQPTSSHATLNNANAVNPSFVPDVGGNYQVQLVVTDAAGNKSAPLAVPFAISGVGSCNQPLTITTPSSPLSTGVAGKVFALDASAATVADPNDPAANSKCPSLATVPLYPIAYAWQMVGLPAGSKAALNNPAAAVPTFTPDIASATVPYSFVLTATDAQGNKGTSQRIDVLAPSACNLALSLTAPVTTFCVGSTCTTGSGAPKVGVYSTPQGVTSVAFALSDPNTSCGTVTPDAWSWSMLARPPGSGASIVDPTAPFGAAFVADLAGTYVLGGRVTNALGDSSAPVQISVVVSGCSSAPSVTVTPASATSAEIGQRVALAATVTDTNATTAKCGAPSVSPFSYAWTLVPVAGSKSAVLASQSAASTSFVPDVAGSYSASVLVTDAVGAQGTGSSASVAVMDCTFTASNLTLTPAGGATGETFTTKQLTGSLSGLAAGCTTPPLVSYQWSFDALPPRSLAQFNAPTDATTGFPLDVPNPVANATPWIVRLTLTDLLSGLSATKTVNINTIDNCGGIGITAGIGVINAAGTTILAWANRPSYPSTSNVTAGTHPVSVQLDGLSGLPATPPNAACGGKAYAFRWTLLQLPPGSAAAITPTTAALPTITLDQTGDYVMSVVVTDGIVTSDASYVRIHAN